MKKVDSSLNNCLINFEGDNNPFGEKFSDVCVKIKETSPFRNFISYSVNKYLLKLR